MLYHVTVLVDNRLVEVCLSRCWFNDDLMSRDHGTVFSRHGDLLVTRRAVCGESLVVDSLVRNDKGLASLFQGHAS